MTLAEREEISRAMVVGSSIPVKQPTAIHCYEVMTNTTRHSQTFINPGPSA